MAQGILPFKYESEKNQYRLAQYLLSLQHNSEVDPMSRPIFSFF